MHLLTCLCHAVFYVRITSLQDNDAESAYVASDTLGPVVSSRTDLEEDYTHITELAAAAVTAGVRSLDLSECRLNTIAAAAFLHAAVEASSSVAAAAVAVAALECVRFDRNPIFGDVCGSGSAGAATVTSRRADSHMRECARFFSALQGASAVRTLSFNDTGMGPAAAESLVASLPAHVTSISALNNALGADGVRSLTHYLLDTNMELHTLCGLEEGQTRLDWRRSAKGPSDMALLACDLAASAVDGRAAAASALSDIALDGCGSVTGTVFGATGGGGASAQSAAGAEEDVLQLDADLSGFESFCAALPGSAVVRVSLRSCFVGQAAVALLAEAVGVPAGLLKQQAVGQNLVVVMEK